VAPCSWSFVADASANTVEVSFSVGMLVLRAFQAGDLTLFDPCSQIERALTFSEWLSPTTVRFTANIASSGDAYLLTLNPQGLSWIRPANGAAFGGLSALAISVP
jgi:hypothetical protein